MESKSAGMMNVFTVLIVMTVSRMYTYVKIHPIVHFEYVQ